LREESAPSPSCAGTAPLRLAGPVRRASRRGRTSSVRNTRRSLRGPALLIGAGGSAPRRMISPQRGARSRATCTAVAARRPPAAGKPLAPRKQALRRLRQNGLRRWQGLPLPLFARCSGDPAIIRWPGGAAGSTTGPLAAGCGAGRNWALGLKRVAAHLGPGAQRAGRPAVWATRGVGCVCSGIELIVRVGKTRCITTRGIPQCAPADTLLLHTLVYCNIPSPSGPSLRACVWGTVQVLAMR
jgi:hypothetical protein